MIFTCDLTWPDILYSTSLADVVEFACDIITCCWLNDSSLSFLDVSLFMSSVWLQQLFSVEAELAIATICFTPVSAMTLAGFCTVSSTHCIYLLSQNCFVLEQSSTSRRSEPHFLRLKLAAHKIDVASGVRMVRWLCRFKKLLNHSLITSHWFFKPGIRYTRLCLWAISYASFHTSTGVSPKYILA